MTALRALLQLHLRQLLRSGIQRGPATASTRRLGRPFYLLLILLFIGYQAYQWGTFWVASHSAVARPVVIILLQPVLTTLGSAAVIVILFYSFTSLMGTFTERRDLQLLLLAPVSPELVLGERILVTSLGFSALLLIVVPALFALGSGVGITAAFYPAVLAVLLVLPVAPTSLGALMLLALLRWLPPARARTISTLVGICLALAFFITTRVLARSGTASLPLLPVWLPTSWPGRFLAAVGLNDGRTALGYGMLTLALAIGLFLLATGVAAQVFATGAGSYAEVRRRKRKPESVETGAAPPVSHASLPEARPPIVPWWPVFVSDWVSLRRDPQRLILFLYPLVIVGFNAFQILARGRTGNPEAAVATTLTLLTLASLLLVMTTTPFLVNRQGKALILLALAPLSPAGIVVSKWITAAIPPLVAVEAALIGLAVYLGLPGGKAALLAVSFAVLIAALSGTILAVNIAWPKFNATNPRRPSSGFATVAGMACAAIMCACTGTVLFLSLFVWTGQVAALGITILFAGLIAVIVVLSQLAPRLLARLMHSEQLLGGA
jgi:ABC-2 type transport system permease protein